MDKILQGKKGPDLEVDAAKLFETIGLKFFRNLGQVNLNKITSGYSKNEHIELDYIIPEKKICLIGEITGRGNNSDIKNKYQKFRETIKLLKNLKLTRELWIKLGIEEKDLIDFTEIELIKGFFITTKEKYDINLSEIEDIAVFYESDYLKLYEYSQTIGKWTKHYFLHNFGIESSTDEAIIIYQKYHLLIKSQNKKISNGDIPLADLYTFMISPYKLLDIAHVHRRDELTSLQDKVYNYQIALNSDKLKDIRKNLLINPDFIFPSNILVILSKECKYTKDGSNNDYLCIPKKYGSIAVIDGQHRLFSYADETIKAIMQEDCKIMVTAIDFKTSDEKVRSEFSAKVFIDINTNQTKVEIAHLDLIAYQLGSNDPKAIATKIIVNLNNRDKFRAFFAIPSDNSLGGIVEAVTIIDAIKKITNLTNIKKLENHWDTNTKAILKKEGYEKLFKSSISDLSDKEKLVEKSTILFETYFNYFFSVFKHDKPSTKNENKSSLSYSKFWAGLVNLLFSFIEDGLDWSQVKTELETIKSNVMQLCNITIYDKLLFDPQDNKIPDASSSPKKTGNFLNENRKKPTSIQHIK